MKYISALTRYDRLSYAVDRHRSPILPEDPGTVHAIRASAKPDKRIDTAILITSPTWREIQRLQDTNEPQFFEDYQNYKSAICGRTVKVLLPAEFHEDDPDACQSCIAKIYKLSQQDSAD